MNINDYLKPEQSINVIASAGTGKTWIIISKILRLLLNDIHPSKITAITFTKKSAAEMTDRLNEKIEYWSELNEKEIEIELKLIGINKNLDLYKDKAKKLFKFIQLNEKDVRITTFDAFFIEILSLMHLDKEIPKNIVINKHPDLIAKDTEKIIFSNDYLSKNIEEKKNIEFLTDSIGSYNNVKESIKGIIHKKSYYLEIKDKRKNKNYSFSEKEQNILNNKNNCIKKILKLIKNTSSENIFLDLKRILLSNEVNVDDKIIFINNFFFTKEKKPKSILKNKLFKISIGIDLFIKIIDDYNKLLYEEIINSWKILIDIFFENYQKLLISKNLIDYDDISWLCYKKLSQIENDNWIYYKISNSINHILVDEFQDTNYKQWKIIEMILDAMSNISNNCTVTIVGDPNQSIYGFRGSDSRLFKTAQSYTKKYFNSIDLKLNESRRSSKQITDYVKKIFTNEKNFSTSIEEKGLVEINTLLNNNNDNSAYILESEAISSNIKKLIRDDNIKYKDILILTRNKIHIKEIEETLVKNSIPVSTNYNKSFLTTPEINDLYYLLKYLIINEEDERNLFLLLLSPIFGYSINEINNKNIKFMDLSKFIIKSKHNKNIIVWKNLVRKIPIHDLLDKIYHDIKIEQLYETENSLKNYNIKNNFLNFLNLSLNINNGRYLTPFKFLYEIERLKNDTTLINNSYLIDSVNILTIHSAKGLESKVVFLAQTYHSNTYRKNLDILPSFNKDLSCRDIYLYLSIFKHNKIIEDNFIDSSARMQKEESNLLYVALTRAKKILIINGFQKKKDCWFNNLSSS
jgi:ATP-dependent helicase/nuclease subunit A